MLFPSIRVIEYPRFNVESGDSASNRDSRLSRDAFFFSMFTALFLTMAWARFDSLSMLLRSAEDVIPLTDMAVCRSRALERSMAEQAMAGIRPFLKNNLGWGSPILAGSAR